MKLIIRIFRKLFVLLVWMAVLLGALFLLFMLTGEALLKPVLVRKAERLTGLKVGVESLHFKADGHFELGGVSLDLGGDDVFDGRLFEAGSVTADISLMSLLKGKPKVNHLSVADFAVNISYDIDLRRLNWEGIKLQKSSGDSSIGAMSFVGGTVRIDKISGDGKTEIAVIPITDVAVAADESGKTYDISFESGQVADTGYSSVAGQVVIGEKINIKLAGEVSTVGFAPLGNKWDMKDVSVEAEFDGTGLYVKWCEFTVDDTNASLTAQLTGFGDELEYKLAVTASDVSTSCRDAEQNLVYGEGMADLIGGGFKRFVENYTPQGVIDADIELSGKVNEIGRSTFVGRLTSKDVSIVYRGFPYKIDKINGRVDVFDTDVYLRQLKGKHGDVELVIDGKSIGTGYDNVSEIIISSDNLVLDDDLYSALGDDQKEQWDKFGPSGRVKVAQRLKCDVGKVYDNELKIELDGVDAVYEDFVYPLKGLTGQVVITEDVVKLIDIVSDPNDAGGLRITINGEVTQTGTDESKYNLDIDARHLAVDDTLMSAMSAEQRSFYGNFEVDGFVDAQLDVSSSAQNSEGMDIVVNLGIDGADVNCRKLPGEFEDVKLKATIAGDTVTIHEMEASMLGGEVKASGKIISNADAVDKIAVGLVVDCKDINVDEELLSFLHENNGGEPNGLGYDANVSLSAKCNIKLSGNDFKVISSSLDCSSGSVDIKGGDFVFEEISGYLLAAKERIVFDKFNVKVRGRDVADRGYKLAIAGGVSLADQDRFENDISVTVGQFALENIAVGGISGKMVGLYEALKPRGMVKMEFDNITVDSSGDREGRLIEFDSDLDFDGLALGGQGDISDAKGRLIGRWVYKIGGGVSDMEGAIVAEQMKLNGYRLSDFKTNYKYDEVSGRFDLDDFSADSYGGKVTGDLNCEPAESGVMGYVLRTKFEGLDVGEFFEAESEEKTDEKINWQGKVFGQLGLDGEFGDTDSRIGRLAVDVTDMKFAKRSFFDKVLASMSLTKPADHMFNEITLDAYIKRNMIVFEKVRMIGDLNVFQGNGTVDLDSGKVDIKLTAFGKDLREDPSLFESLARGIGGAVVKVEVGGSISEPDVTVTPLPVVMWPIELLMGDKKDAED